MDDFPSPPQSPTTVIRHATSATLIRRQARPVAAPGWQQSRWPYVLFSLLLGSLLWIGIDTKRMQDTELVVDLGMQHIVPADWKNTVLSDSRIVVSVRGAKQLTSTIREDAISVEPNIPPEAFNGDVFEAKLGISPSQVRGLPPGVQAFAVKPEIISVRFDKMVTRYLPVEPGEITGTPASGYVIGRVSKPEPPDLPITGLKSVLDNLAPGDVIRTESLSVEGQRGTVKEWIKPMPFVKNGKTIDVDGIVSLTVELTEAPIEKTLELPLDVKALIDAPFNRYDNLAFSPPSVSVTVSGPKSAVDNLNPGEIVIFADIRERLPAAPGEYYMKCRYLAPPRVQIVKIEPDTVKWTTHENAPTVAEAAPDGAPAH